jgi:hypothetical protein
MDSFLIGVSFALVVVAAFFTAFYINYLIVRFVMRKMHEIKINKYGVSERFGQIVEFQSANKHAQNDGYIEDDLNTAQAGFLSTRQAKQPRTSVITHGSSIDSVSKPANRGDLDSNPLITGGSALTRSVTMHSSVNDSGGDSSSDSGGSGSGSGSND